MVNRCKDCDCKEREAFYRSFEDGKPFFDKKEGDYLIRTFLKETEPHLLKWHIDEEDRIVTPMNENDWLFQYDNELPFLLDHKIKIKSGIFHRIIKGTTDLIIKIEKPNADSTTGISVRSLSPSDSLHHAQSNEQ